VHSEHLFRMTKQISIVLYPISGDYRSIYASGYSVMIGVRSSLLMVAF
jgi:hypothetical protein